MLELSVEDADFELSVLLNRAEKGRLTPEIFAQSEIAKRLDTAQVMSINEGLRVDPVATVNSLAQALQKTQSSTQPTIKQTTKSETQPAAAPESAASAKPVEPGFVRVYHSGSQLDQYVCRAALREGKNTILVKVCQNEQTQSWARKWHFQLRVCDAQGTAVLSTDRDTR